MWFKSFYTVASKTMVGLLRFFLWVAEWERGACLPPIFILCAEVLDNAVRKDENSHGINSTKVECKLSQYADDTTMILDRSKLSLSRTLYLLGTFAISSGGLKMIEVQSSNESLRIKWIKGYLDDNNQGKWKFFDNYPEKHSGKLVFSANLKRQDTPIINISDPFVAETVEYWSTF